MAATNVVTQNYPMASLYVGDLHPEVTEAMLFDKFSSVGPVLSIRVCRDMITRRSLGYAYVNFQQPADAERALDSLNYESLRGRQLRIMWSQRDPALRKSGVGNVFIKNLDKNIDNKSLYDTFSTFGNILSCKIMTEENGQSKGFGFIHFETQESADKAIEKVHGMLLAGKIVHVGRFMSRSQRGDGGGNRKFTNLYIKNFATLLDQKQFEELLEPHGKILSAKIVTDENGISKGFGFCSFETHEEAEKAVQALNGYKLEDRVLFVGRFQKKQERINELKRKKDQLRQERLNKYQGVNLYIKNLDDSINDERLIKEFTKFGTITSAKVMSEGGRSKGFGFVCFSAPDEATKAVTEMNGCIVGSKPLYVALAQRKDERRQHLVNQHMNRMMPRTNAQMSLPFPSTVNGMVPYMPGLMGPAQPRTYYPTPGATYRQPQPRWPTAIPPNNMRQPTGPPMFPTQMPPSTLPVNQRPNVSYGINPNRVNMQPSTRTPMASVVPNNANRPPMGKPQTAAYTQGARNLPPNNMAAAPSSILVPGQEPLTPAALANASPQEQKQMLGERLFPLIHRMVPELAGKITGMLLEIDNTELLHMLESHDSLRSKVEEAIAVLNAHQAKQMQGAK